MKKITSLLVGCALALAGAAMAQQPEEQSTPKPDQAVEKGKGHPMEVKPPGAKEMKEMKHPGTPVERHGGKNEPGGIKMEKAEAPPKPVPSVPKQTKVEKAAREKTPGATPGVMAEEHKKGMKTPAETAKTPVAPIRTATAPPAAKINATPVAKATAAATPAQGASPAPSMAVAGERNVRAPGTAKKPDPQQVLKIKAQNANFKAQPKPEKVPTVTFTENRRIEGSDQWQGHQYEAFRSYRAERHDQGWYQSRYTRVELIGGGYYYWNAGYWYPAWGYNESHQYYAYDGPIYVGRRVEPLDRVIADVQGVLQEMGYYRGEVDGLLGPLTREALTSYQQEQGLAPTAAIDEPTLDALGMGS